MLAQARTSRSVGYEQELVQVMREHDLLAPGEEEQMIDYLFRTI
ncbi:MAG TPA: hypothetical protein VJ461_05695 [Candidatus Nanoarchaeia archaeon]|nr:hypothetical protein [Candidatus Nanoarchaeia archaeon]